MLTLDQVFGLRNGDILYHIFHRNSDGTPERWKVNGKVKRWKREPSRFRVPIKHGLYNYDYLEPDNLRYVRLSEAQALEGQI